MITEKSKLKDIWNHPVGHDILYKFLLMTNKDPAIVTNPLAANMPLSALKKLAKGILSDGFWDAFLNLINMEQDVPAPNEGPVRHEWWKEAVFYQIYPRSFCDSNGDGLGDLPGIISKLDYLKSLGVDAVWLSPIYDSPLEDNGYDIRDYHRILAEFGTMEDFDRLLDGVHERGMKLIMDLVVNHTSDEHPWFQSAISDPDSEYGSYYILQDGTPDKLPNNWTSNFRGPAWNYYESVHKWGLHLFSAKQMDLNWENPKLRADICAMIRWWLEKGVDGFRMDVINYISKVPGLPDGDEGIGGLIGFTGIEHYFYGPRLHEYLRQIRKEAFEPYHAFSVGETPGVGTEMGKLIAGDDRGELDMVFSFDQLDNPGKMRFDDYRYDLNHMKKHFMEWTAHCGSHCWQSLFFENHDNPRMVSKVTDRSEYHPALAKLLLTVQLTLPGTPFIYQGQEWNTPNHSFRSIDEFKDVESLNLYAELCKKKSPEEAFRTVLSGSRDHARIPLNWAEGARQEANPDSTFRYVRALTAYRRAHIDTLVYGDTRFLDVNRKNYWSWTRTSAKETILVECNLSDRETARGREGKDLRFVTGNYGEPQKTLRPYEVLILTNAGGK